MHPALTNPELLASILHEARACDVSLDAISFALYEVEQQVRRIVRERERRAEEREERLRLEHESFIGAVREALKEG